ncbi:DinB family protein [Lysinibacillus sp. KU-BSD001]|uniref:DinB family protein n=1 Tax=Lysinibacillus sp. KU-BSD001 TaxID=3141328 RepID=UPI0036EC9817
MEHNVKIREKIWESISSLTDEQLNAVVEEGTWSIAQILEHLYLLEENVGKQIAKTLLNKDVNVLGAFPVHVVADRKRKVEAPHFLLPSNEPQTLAELKHKLTTSRETLMHIIGEASDSDLTEKAFAHHRFGTLSLKQWVALIGYHEERHLGQIEEVKQALAKKV